MTLRASLLSELESPNLSADRRAVLCCELAKQFEDKGEYEEAGKALNDYWQGLGERLNVPGLEPNSTAELLLRVGVLTGIIGSKTQLADADEATKNLITESLGIFEAIPYPKKIAEAQTELALCYWRTGEHDNAAGLLKLALNRLITDSELKAKAVLRLAIVEQETGRYGPAL